MSKKSKSESKLRRRKEKKARREANRLKYQSWAAAGRNGKRKEGSIKKAKVKRKSSYIGRWGHERIHVLKGHPKRTARQLRAYLRGAPTPKTREVANADQKGQ
jgi:hypothetical protein